MLIGGSSLPFPSPVPLPYTATDHQSADQSLALIARHPFITVTQRLFLLFVVLHSPLLHH
jgi:hypothetical protein